MNTEIHYFKAIYVIKSNDSYQPLACGSRCFKSMESAKTWLELKKEAAITMLGIPEDRVEAHIREESFVLWE